MIYGLEKKDSRKAQMVENKDGTLQDGEEDEQVGLKTKAVEGEKMAMTRVKGKKVSREAARGEDEEVVEYCEPEFWRHSV